MLRIGDYVEDTLILGTMWTFPWMACERVQQVLN